MSDAAVNVPIDFTLGNIQKRRMLYFKRPKGTAIPVGLRWACVCGHVNVLNERDDQYCTDCGSRLRNQENDNPTNTYHTCVIVSHFSLTPQSRR